MKIKVTNSAGRHLGTYDADDNQQAADALALENGFANSFEAECAKLFCAERLRFTVVEMVDEDKKEKTK